MRDDDVEEQMPKWQYEPEEMWKEGAGPYREGKLTPPRPPAPRRRWWRMRVATWLPLALVLCAVAVMRPSDDNAVALVGVGSVLTIFIGSIAAALGAWDAVGRWVAWVWWWLIDEERA